MKVIKLLFLTAGIVLVPCLAQGMGIAHTVFNFLTANRYITTPAPLNYPKHYSINVMWINKAHADTNYIYPSRAENNFGKTYFDTIFSWAIKNPDASINIWFDSALTSESAIKTTQEYITQNAPVPDPSQIVLKDIRSFKKVKQNQAIFSSDIPVYFRADLLRAIAAEEVLSHNQETCFVYCDFDVQPLSKDQLFDRTTLARLNKHHYVMAKENNKLGFENSLQIFTHDQSLLKALKHMVIDANIIRAYSFIDDMNEKNDSTSPLSDPHVWKVHEIGFQENVFYSYPFMHAHFNQMHNIGFPLLLPGQAEPYSEENQGKKTLNENAKFLMTHSTILQHLTNSPIPTKHVSIPESTSAYKELTEKREL